MKKKAVGVIFAVLVMLISFQNCQKPPYPDEISGQNITFTGQFNKIELGQESVTGINFLIQDTQSVTKAGNTYQINFNKTLKIDLNTGVIVETSDISSTVVKYCLTEDLKNELNSILKSSQICLKTTSVPVGLACAQVMKLAYAQIVTTREQFDLGSATDGCGSNGVDLCEEQPGLLKGYIEAIKKQYSRLACN